ncbi:ELWxxDGT repeat protein [Nocardioides nitrophenolicus]|uniref:ELWxxDGT repeat protein n=1 Tax=Nocardioides nitrophenolicus TaxID=60489 RepID=UPI00195A6424|nr:ELWxxDGT repeat protein [Nocardioides nitrophenolicus]MBM7518210.1 ELWxxDGT repeat protein [Nocardioides nitrophenolicus]
MSPAARRRTRRALSRIGVAASVAAAALTCPYAAGAADDDLVPQLVKDIAPGPDGSWPDEFVTFDGSMYFAAFDDVAGTELWRSDGTSAGTTLVKDIAPGSTTCTDEDRSYACPISSWPTNLAVFGGALYFSADDGSHGRELWTSDGTAAGTVLVKDISAGTTSDEDGTRPAGSYPRSFTPMGGALYFTADDGGHGEELWRTDGTESGTVLVKDVNPATESWAGVGQVRAAGGYVYYISDRADGRREVWRSDGTAAGTVPSGLPGGSYYADDPYLVPVGDTLYAFTGSELWTTDGTTVDDVGPAPATRDYGGASFAKVLGDTVFFAGHGPDGGNELWKTDGTAPGTVRVKDLYAGDPDDEEDTDGKFISQFRVMGDVLYFVADDVTHGRELWRSDGTEAGTAMVKDIHPNEAGAWSNGPEILAVLGTELYLTADDGSRGREIWRSDGTAAGTVLVAELNPGSAGVAGGSGGWEESVAASVYDGHLYFGGDDGQRGRELWRLGSTADSPGDVTPPDTAIAAGPAAGSVSTSSSVSFAFTAVGDDTTRFQCRIDDQLFAACTSPHTATGLGSTTHTFEVRAVDASGNIDPTPAARTFTVAVPTPPAGPTSPTPAPACAPATSAAADAAADVTKAKKRLTRAKRSHSAPKIKKARKKLKKAKAAAAPAKAAQAAACG